MKMKTSSVRCHILQLPMCILCVQGKRFQGLHFLTSWLHIAIPSPSIPLLCESFGVVVNRHHLRKLPDNQLEIVCAAARFPLTLMQ